MSQKKGELLREAERSSEHVAATEGIKDPYVLEFLGLPEPRSEQDLETATGRSIRS